MSYGSNTFSDGSNNDQYFATLAPDKTAGILLGKADSFYNVLRANSYLDKLVMMYRAYYGSYGDSGHQINFTGEQGELVHFPVNHFRNLAQHMLNMITANRPVMEARAVNNDYKSMAQTYLANGILDYYMREKRLEDCLKKGAEMAIVLGSGFIKLDWNATAGETYDFDEDTQQFSYEGEIEFSNLSPFDVVVDGTKESWNNDWILVRSFQNRYNLIAKYPELAEKLHAIPAKSESGVYRMSMFSNDQTDDVPVFEFFHRKTEAVPDGRYMLFADVNTILLDTHLPYRTVPIFRITAGEIMGTPYGYSPMFDVFPIQEMINATYSAIATNQNTFAVQNLWVPHGADLNISTLEGAMNVVTGNAKPEALNLTQTPKEVFEFLTTLIHAAETISGINSVARGNPEANLKSGNALALVQSMALQFISGLQHSYVKLIEDVGSSVITILKDFAMTPKTVALVGKNNKPLLKEFTGESINAINRVIVDVGNPLSHTTAGRVQMAEQLLQMKLIHAPEQYFQVINTGRIDSMYHGEMSELLLIQSENESLLEGNPIRATAIDKHKLHIEEHRSVIAGPELRNDPTLVQNTLNHIQDHINLLRNTDPDLLVLIGEQPLPQPGQQPPGQPGPGGPQGGPPQGAPQGGPPPRPFPSMMPPQPQQQSHPQQPPQHQGPPVHPLQRSPMSKLMGTEDGNIGPGQKIRSEELGNTSIPMIAKPPKPFNQLPVLAQNVLPK